MFSLHPPPSSLTQAFEAALPQILGALPEDWESEVTTYDLPRFYAEAEFVSRFQSVVQQLAQQAHEPAQIQALLASCGHPYDYARLGHPLSTVYELYLQEVSGARRVISFASQTKPFLAVIEARADLSQPVLLFTPGHLPLSEAKKTALQQQQVQIHAHWEGPLPPPSDTAVHVFVSDQPGFTPDLAALDADAICFPLAEGGVLLVKTARIDPAALQLVRKRTASALLAANAKAELCRLAGVPVPPLADGHTADCDVLLRDLFPEMRASAYFCTGLAAEAAVFSATASLLSAGQPVRLFYAENGYGGTCQLIADILPRETALVPVPLPVLARDADGQTVTLVDRMIAALEELAGAPACLFLETPTNPELQVHDFPRLMAALHQYQREHGLRIPLLVDTTLAPLYPLLAQDFAQDWPCVIVKSGSKYFTKGKATLGVALAGDDPLARQIVAAAQEYARDADTGAKSSQLLALSQGLADLRPRMERIAAHTRELAEGIRAGLKQYGHDVLLYSFSEAQTEAGLASGVLSFYLPAAPSSHGDLVDEFVDYLLLHAPALVKNRVSYGQASADGRADVFYVINPEESTQGALSEAVKAAQKRDNVQICRISVPEHTNVAPLLHVIQAFFERKYAA